MTTIILAEIAQSNNITLKNHFVEGLPYKPYHCNEKGYLRIASRYKALLSQHIQFNQPGKTSWIVIDCDEPNIIDELKKENANFPVPNFVVSNPKNYHSHLYFGLELPVLRTACARRKPIDYLACVEYELRRIFKGDPGYSGLIAKNPMHPYWDTDILNTDLWMLEDFREHMTVPSHVPTKEVLHSELGRNVTVFNTVREIAYKNLLAFRVGGGNQEGFFEFVRQECERINGTFKEQLPEAEIKSIARSVSKWTWRQYTGVRGGADWQQYVQDTHTPEIQRERQKFWADAQKESSKNHLRTARILQAKGLSQKQIAEKIGVDPRTIRRLFESK